VDQMGVCHSAFGSRATRARNRHRQIGLLHEYRLAVQHTARIWHS